MKKLLIAFSLLLVFMLCSCGPSLKSMKEADAFLIQERAKGLASDGGKIYTSKQRPEYIKTNSDTAGDATTGILMGGPLIGLASAVGKNPLTKYPKKGKKVNGIVEIRAHVSSDYHTLYRKEKDGDAWDLTTEALKRAGSAPQVNMCHIESIGIDDSFAVQYKGDDGQIRMARFLYPAIYVKGYSAADPPCMGEDLDAYEEYLDRIVNSIKEILTEENERLDKAAQK